MRQSFQLYVRKAVTEFAGAGRVNFPIYFCVFTRFTVTKKVINSFIVTYCIVRHVGETEIYIVLIEAKNRT